MAKFTRRNAWNENGTFDNPDLLWYAKGVGEMQQRQLDDPTSWWFYAAIHGQYILRPDLRTPFPAEYPNWNTITGPPQVPTSPLPSTQLRDLYWNQCQHNTWFFLPWHRGYLYAIENILRDIIVSLGGPADWALPYWNYFGSTAPGSRPNQHKMPPAFAEKNLPNNGGPNPLYVEERLGPNLNRDIFIRISPQGINQECQKTRNFTERDSVSYGGPKTTFSHAGQFGGANENNPHGGVHIETGGRNRITGRGGLMSRAGRAALDPLFYLHHCNIDRMWAAWNVAGRLNSTDPDWLNGPTAFSDRKFVMPNPDQTKWQYTPAMMNDNGQLDYTYEDLSLGIVVTEDRDALRLANFGLTTEKSINLMTMEFKTKSDIVGSNANRITVDTVGAQTTVQLDTRGWQAVANTLENAKAQLAAFATVNNLPDKVYLQLEGIKGNEDSIICDVIVNQQPAGKIYLFGLFDASIEDGHSVGGGLTKRLDISQIIDSLQLENSTNLSTLDVQIKPEDAIAAGSELTVERISVYRESQL